MKRAIFPILIVSLMLSGAACMLPMMGGGAIGGLYTDITSPGTLGHTTTYQITPESDFESLAFVEGTSEGVVILGLIATGNFGYGAAIENALSQAPGATRLIDITVDTHLTSILGLYSKFTTKVRGRAVRMKKK